MVRFGIIYGMVWCGRYSVVRCCLVWCGVVWKIYKVQNGVLLTLYLSNLHYGFS